MEREASEKYTVFPIKYTKLWDFYKKHEASFWTVEEVRLKDDLTDWKKLNDNEKYFIKNILAFFAASDGIVNENLVFNFYNEVQIPEARCFYSIQIMIETIHSEQYAVLIDTYVIDEVEKNRLFNAIETIPVVKKKADWALKWIEEGTSLNIPKKYMEQYKLIEDKLQEIGCTSEMRESLEFLTKEKPNFGQRLIAFICVEGLFFSGSFCAIYWLKARGLMPGLCTANEFISRDENLHAEFAIELYKMLDERVSEEVVHAIFKDAVTIEQEFITESLPVSLIGMNCNLMKQYIEYVADRWLILLGYRKIYDTQNPFTFMELISLNSKCNFFENTVTSYQKPGVGTTDEDRELSFNDDF